MIDIFVKYNKNQIKQEHSLPINYFGGDISRLIPSLLLMS
jgi:hypothetical protein